MRAPNHTGSSENIQVLTGTWQDAWVSLLDRLDALGRILREKPNKQTVADLSELCMEFEAAVAQMPDDSLVVLANLEGKIATLMAYCRDLQSGTEFDWLEGSLLEQ